jgi:hypothetical protein
MRTARQHRIDRAVARVLAATGAYMLPEGTVIDEVGLLVIAPRATQSEIEESIRHHDSSGRLTGVSGDMGTKWKLNDAGRAWWGENQ